MGKGLIIVRMLFLCITANAQEELPDEPPLELMAEQGQDIPEDDEQWQQRSSLLRRKMNLNTADAEELSSLGWLDDLQIAYLLEYRAVLGGLISIYELQAVPGFDLPLIRKILPFVQAGSGFEPYYTWKDYWRKGTHVLLTRYARPLELAKGYGDGHYLGSADKYMLRYRYQLPRRVSWGLVWEKDGGERIMNGHYGFHLMLKKDGRSLVLGDYVVNMGQGLVQWHGLAFGKGAAVTQVKKQGEVLRPYASAGEFYFFRGAGATVRVKSWEATVFGSHRVLDARLSADTLSESGTLVSTGYHRTAAELALRGNMTQSSAGVVVRRYHRNGHVACNAIGHRFSGDLRTGDEPYRLYAPRGNTWLNSSIDHAFGWRNFHFFGEAAVNIRGKPALMQGVIASLGKLMDMALVYRYEDVAYHTGYGNAFGESAAVGNERGLYTALLMKWNSRWQLSAYADVFRFPWLKYRVSAPSEGYDVLVSLDWHPDKVTVLQLQYRYLSKPQDLPAGETVHRFPVIQCRRQVRSVLSVPVSAVVNWRCRVQVGRYFRDIPAGGVPWEAYLVQQQWQVRWRSCRLVLAHSWFSTDQSEGLYVSGEGFPGDNSLVRLAGRGQRLVLQCRWNVSRRWTLWGACQRTMYVGIQETGTGQDAVAGDNRTTFQWQSQWNF